MIEYPLINKRELRKNKLLKNIQKVSYKKYPAVKRHFLKLNIGKIVKLRAKDNYYDLTNNDYLEQDLLSPNRDIILNDIKSQRVCGLSGSGFSTYQKLQAVIDSKAKDKYLIINGVECDPGLVHDEWLIENRYKEIEKGIELLAKCVNFKKIIIASKVGIATTNTCFSVYTVPNRYPIGAEKILIKEVLGITFTPDEIPSRKGIIVLNLQTVHAIYDAVYMKRPANTRFITVADLTTGEAVVARVIINSEVYDITSKITNLHINQPIYYGGGIMMGRKAESADRISINTNFIGYGKEAPHYQEVKCRKCGACSRNCPMHIKVQKVVQKLKNNIFINMEVLHPEHCIKCGTCTYFCPAEKNVMKLVAAFKERIL